MTFDEVFARLRQSGLDPEQRTRATVDATLETFDSRMRAALEAAAVPHSFNVAILARLLEVDQPEAEALTKQLAAFSFVETFTMRGGWNVHKMIRTAVRLKLHSEEPERFRLLSRRAAACRDGDEFVNRVEAIYHGLYAEPEKTADELERTYIEWTRSGRLEALHMLATALEELRTFPLENTARASALVYLGWIRMYRYPLDKTEDLAREVLRIAPRHGRSGVLADANLLLGLVLDRRGKANEALPHLQTGQALLTEALEADSAKVEIKRDLAVAHILIARNYNASGAIERAIEQYNLSRLILQELIDVQPDNSSWKRELSVTYCDLGRIYEEQKNFSRALEMFQTDRSIAESLAAAEPENPDRKRDLAVSYNNTGRLLMEQRMFPQALQEYQAYHDIMQALINVDPSSLDWQRELSVAVMCVGTAYRSLERSADAIEAYQASRRILQGLTELDPGNAGWHRDLSTVNDRMGRAYREQRLFPEALASFARSKEIIEELLATERNNIEWLRELSFVYHQIGRTYEMQEDMAGALSCYEQNLAIAERVAALQPNNDTRKYEVRLSLEALERVRDAKPTPQDNVES